MNLPFRAMVSDLGGTLLTPEHLVGDLTIDTLRVLEQKGVDIILATGRNHTDMSSILGKIGAERAVMITSNGARVRDLQGNLLYSNSLPEELVLELYKTSYVGNLIQIPKILSPSINLKAYPSTVPAAKSV